MDKVTETIIVEVYVKKSAWAGRYVARFLSWMVRNGPFELGARITGYKVVSNGHTS